MRNFELFCAEGDGLTILVEFEGDKVINTIEGDEYHDKIHNYIEGYLDGIKDVVEVTEFWIDIDDISDFDWQEERNNEVRVNTYIWGEK